MANTVQNTLNKVGNTLEAIFGTASTPQPNSNKINGDGKQTNLEKYGIEARKYHILRNEWRKDLEYSKPLVDAEYMIQTEFKIGDSLQEIKEKESTDKVNRMNKEAAAREKAQQKMLKDAEKAAEKEAKKAAKVGKVANKDNTSNTNTSIGTSTGDNSWMQFAQQYGYLPTA